MKPEMAFEDYRERLHIGEVVYLIDDRDRTAPEVKKGTVIKRYGFRGRTEVRLWPDTATEPGDIGRPIIKWPRDLFTHADVMEAIYGEDALDPLMQSELANIDETIENPMLNRDIMLNKLGAIVVDRTGDDFSDSFLRNR